MKFANHTLIKSNACYTFKELAEVLNVSLTTIRNWHRDGLKTLEEKGHPLLIVGYVAKQYLIKKKSERKIVVRKGEFFCRKCRQSRNSIPELITMVPTERKIGKSKQIIVKGICEICNTGMMKFSTEEKITECGEPIHENGMPSVNLYLDKKERMNHNINNEKVKRLFSQWIREAEGLAEHTITGMLHAIKVYEEFTQYEDFKLFNENKAINFKRYLRERKFNGSQISDRTYLTYLKYLKKFFAWLSQIPGYKSRIRGDSVSYLKLSKRDDTVARQYVRSEFPMPDYCIQLAKSIPESNELDFRDRAAISLLFLTGMRPRALTTLPLECVDEQGLYIYQDPRLGVKTKYSKYIPSKIFNFDADCIQFIVQWIKLIKEKGFSPHDPFFPISKPNKKNGQISFSDPTEVQPIFYTNSKKLSEILYNRSVLANMKYYPPRTFRHTTVYHSLKFVRTAEEYKAVSQHFGHEDIKLTLSIYGKLDETMLFQILDRIDFSNNVAHSNEELENALKIINSAISPRLK